jgi:hypothetical protein
LPDLGEAAGRVAEGRMAETNGRGRNEPHLGQPRRATRATAAAAGHGVTLSRDAAELAGHALEAGRSIAGQLVEEFRSAAETLVEEQKAKVAATVHGLGDFLHLAAEKLRPDNPPIARYADQTGRRIHDFSERVRERRWSEIVADTEAFAHRQPALFLLGAAALGFAAARFAAAAPSQARPDRRDPARRRGDPGMAGYGAESTRPAGRA